MSPQRDEAALAREAILEAVYQSTSPIGMGRDQIVAAARRPDALAAHMLRDAGFEPGTNPLRGVQDGVFDTAISDLQRSADIEAVPGKGSFRAYTGEYVKDAIASTGARPTAQETRRPGESFSEPRRVAAPTPPRPVPRPVPPVAARPATPPLPPAPTPAPMVRDEAKRAEPVVPVPPRPQPATVAAVATPAAMPELDSVEKVVLRLIHQNHGHSITRGQMREGFSKAKVVPHGQDLEGAMKGAVERLSAKGLVVGETRLRQTLTENGVRVADALWPKRRAAGIDMAELQELGLMAKPADPVANFTAALGNVVGQGTATYEAVMAEFRRLNEGPRKG